MKLNDLQKHEITEWSTEVEDLLRSLSDKSQVWTELHLENHLHFRKRYYNLIIPIIVLSSITGSANLALGSLPTGGGETTVINLVIGVVGIITSVLSTLNNIFSFQKRKDDHKRAADEWSRIHRIIDIEINLARPRRNNVSTFLFLVLQEVERIFDTQPKLRNKIKRDWIKRYNWQQKKIFKRQQNNPNSTNSKTIENALVDLPEILMLKRTLVYQDSNRLFQSSNLHVVPTTPIIPIIPTMPTMPTIPTWNHASTSHISNDTNTPTSSPETGTPNENKSSTNIFSKAVDLVRHRFNISSAKDDIDSDSTNTTISENSNDDNFQINHNETVDDNHVAQILIDMTTLK